MRKETVMKKTFGMILALVIALSLCACGGGNPDTTNPADKDSTQQNSPDTAGPEGYTFTYKNVQLWIGMDAADAIATLGEPKDRAVTESCAFNGNDIVYDYQSVKISTNDENGYEMVYCIELADDMAQTEEGIKLGASGEAVTAAYGEPATENPGGYIYVKDGMELRFLLSDGKVTSIQYLLKGAA